jgi:type IV pilus assembly protein PilA
MKKVQQGFTLIELMIVVAIIGILAAIAIPAYQDYTIRTQVSEGMTLASGAKTAIAEYYSHKGAFPADNDQAGLATNVSIAGQYVLQVDTAAGVVTSTFNATNAHTAIQGAVLEISAITHAGSVEWICGSGGTTVAEKYLPSNCRP